MGESNRWNNYAISTADLATSLTKSSGSLVAANGTMEEAVALTATANTIIQDPDVVGTALKTVAMRIRGTSVEEMEEEGLETDGMVESSSKLQGKIKGLSGIDILTDTGAYKSTYQILSEIADVWESMNDMDRAALLELLAGKRAGSVMSAILQSPETLKDAFESAGDATGSALEENEKYLDSVQGKMDLFTNAVQTMWNSEMNSDLIKWFVELGTVLIKVIDKVTLLGAALIALVAYTKISSKLSWAGYFASIGSSITTLNTKLTNLAIRFGILNTVTAGTSVATKGITVGMIQERLAIAGVDAETQKLILSKMGLDATNKNQILSSEVAAITTLKEAVANKTLTTLQAYSIAQKLGLITATKGLNGLTAGRIAQLSGLNNHQTIALVKELGLIGTTRQLTKEEIKNAIAKAGITDATKAQTLQNLLLAASQGKVIASMKLMLFQAKEWISKNSLIVGLAAGVAAALAFAKVVDLLTESMEEAKEKFTELKSELETTESQLKDFESELKEINSQIEELNSQESLSFTDQEELDRLKAQSEEIQRQIDLTNALKQQQQKKVNDDAIDVIDKYKDIGITTGKTTGDNVSDTVKVTGGIGAGITGAAATMAAFGTSMSWNVVGWIALVAAAVTAAAGSIAYVVSESEDKVGESLDNMKEQYDKLKSKLDDAKEKYGKDATDKNKKKYEKAQEDFDEYNSMMAEHLMELDAYYSSIDLSVYDPDVDAEKIAQLRKEINDFYDQQDKWAIQSGGQNAKVNAITRIFGENASDELKRIKSEIQREVMDEDWDGSLNLSEYFNTADLDAFTDRLHEMGIYVYEVENYFKDMAIAEKEATDVSLYGVVTDIDKITEGLEGLAGAFDEVRESGSATAKTLTELNEVFGTLGNSWDNYVNAMFSGVSSTKEMIEATEELAKAFIDSKLLTGEEITEYERMTYIIQLRKLGVTNAEEYVDDKIEENAYKAIQNSATYDKLKLEDNFNKLTDENKNKLGIKGKSFSELTTEELEKIADYYDMSKIIDPEKVQEIIDEYGIEMQLQVTLSNDTPDNIKSELKKLGEGGAVDLSVRPKVDSTTMNAAGWNVEEGSYSTVDTSTFSNADGTIAMNFTPILPNGDVLTPGELQEYAEGVIAGTRTDDLGLQIGAVFTGESAIDDASNAAEQIHLLHEQYLTDEISNNQVVIDLLQKKIDKEKELADTRASQKKYDNWLNGDGGYNQTIEKFEYLRNKMKNFSDEIINFNKSEWSLVPDGPGGKANSNTMKNSATGDTMTRSDYAALEYQAQKFEDWKKQNKDIYNQYVETKKQLDKLKQSEEGKKWLNEDGTLKEGVEAEFKAAVEAAEEGVEDLENQIETKLTADVEIDLELTKSKQLVDDIQSIFDTLSNAQEEYNESGYLSVDTLQGLIELEPKYLALLYDENGNLNLNKDTLYQVAIARLTDMKLKQQDMILSEAEQLAAKGSIDALYEQIDVTYGMSEAYDVMIAQRLKNVRAILEERKANGELRDYFDVDAYISSIQHQLDAVEAATNSSIKNIHNSLSSSNKAEQKSAFEKLQEKYERKISNLDNQQTYLENEIERLEAENKGVSRSYYEEQIDIEEQKMALLQQERTELTKLLNSTKKGSDDWWEIAGALWDVEHAIQESTLRTIEFRESIADLYKTAFEDLDKAYGDKDDLYSDRQAYIEKYMELLELQGEAKPASAYLGLIAEEEAKLANSMAELNDLRQVLADGMANGDIKEGDERWIEMQSSIRETEAAILDSKVALEQYNEELKNLEVEAFEMMRNAFSNRNDYYTNQQDYIEGYIDYLEEAM